MPTKSANNAVELSFINFIPANNTLNFTATPISGGAPIVDATAGVYANGAFETSNSASSYANGAFVAANTKLSTSGGTITGDLTINGNITVSGCTATLTVETLRVHDSIVDVAWDVTGVPALDAGIRVVRGDSNPVMLKWNESIDKWTFTNDGTSYSNIGSSAAEDYANGLVDQEILDRDTAIESQAFISGNALANAITDLEEYTDNAISDHNLATLNVHGISNTAVLVTLTDLSNHESDTSNVHGITNTLAVVLTDDARLSDARTPLANSVTNNSISGTIDQNKITNLATTLGNLASLSGAAFTGNVSTTGSLSVDGDFTVSGSNVLVSATQIQIEDTLLQLGHTNANNVTDLGLVVSYNDGTQKHAGIVKDVTDGKWKLFDGVTSEPSTTVNFGQGSLDVLALLTLEANSVTATSDITANGIVFTDGTQRLEGVPSRTPIIQKTASYTLSALTERDDLIEMDSVSATTLTIPLNAAVAFPVGTSIDILQTNTGQVTIAGDAGVTVNATPGLKLRTRWSSCTLFKRATNTWVVYGDLSA